MRSSHLGRTLNTLIEVSGVYLVPFTSCWYSVLNQRTNSSINTFYTLSIPGQSKRDLSRRMWHWYRFTPNATLFPSL